MDIKTQFPNKPMISENFIDKYRNELKKFSSKVDICEGLIEINLKTIQEKLPMQKKHLKITLIFVLVSLIITLFGIDRLTGFISCRVEFFLVNDIGCASDLSEGLAWTIPGGFFFLGSFLTLLILIGSPYIRIFEQMNQFLESYKTTLNSHLEEYEKQNYAEALKDLTSDYYKLLEFTKKIGGVEEERISLYLYDRFVDFIRDCERKLSRCELCLNNPKKYTCPDCDRKVCPSCWDKSMGICIGCKNKMQMLTGKSVTPIESDQQPTNPLLSSPNIQSPIVTEGMQTERLIKLRNALQLAKQIPLSILIKSLAFSNQDDFNSWLIEIGIPGIEIDFEKSLLKITNTNSIDTLNSFIDAFANQN